MVGRNGEHTQGVIMPHFMYILQCADGSYYIGCSENPEARVREHNGGVHGATYTAHRRPVNLVYSESFATLADAMKREIQLRGWSRAKKEALVKGDAVELKALSRRQKR
jgi:putative endonuclease